MSAERSAFRFGDVLTGRGPSVIMSLGVVDGVGERGVILGERTHLLTRLYFPSERIVVIADPTNWWIEHFVEDDRW